MKIKRFYNKGILVFTWLCLSFLAGHVAEAAWGLKLSTMDTIAGYSALIKTSQLQANEEVDFLVVKPNETEISFKEKANMAGVLEAELYGHNTKQAGLYTVQAKRAHEKQYAAQTSFKVYADTVSSSQSGLISDKTTASGNGNDQIYIKVTLTDGYQNPVENHQVKLISSRPEDEIERASSHTSDENGNVVFQVSSRYPGISVFSAFDVNTGITIDDRIKIVFFTPAEDHSPRWGSILQADLFSADTIATADGDGSSGPAQYFELVMDHKDEIPINEAQTITVIAKDKNKNTAKDYSGTVLFATPDDENATLPSDDGEYKFKDSDLGEFTFNLAITFTKPGSQTIQVFDKDDWDLEGELAVTVVEKSVDQTPSNPGGSLEIKTPADGSELSTHTVNISGKGTPDDLLKFFDDDYKIGETEVDADGFFTFEAKNLEDGSHAIYAMWSNEKLSETIKLTIDTTPPSVDDFQVIPDGELESGATYRVKVISEPNLRKSQVRVNGIPEDLTESSQTKGVYEATLVAPDTGGSYPLDVVLTDAMWNKGEYNDKSALRVTKAKILMPPKVTGVRAFADISKVNLSWTAVSEYAGVIVKYKIYYGTSQTNLNLTTETNSAVNAWFIDNLTNGQKYYFNVTAVDNQWMESQVRSLTVSAVPTEPEPTVTAVGSDTKVTLNWKAFGNNPARYKIRYGVESGRYLEEVLTSSNKTTWYVPHLINNVQYYFQVVAVDAYGNILEYADEISATPYWSGLKPVAGGNNFNYTPTIIEDNKPPENNESGPETWIVLLFSVVFVDIILRLRNLRG